MHLTFQEMGAMALPIVGTLLSRWLKTNGQRPGFNACIAALFLLATATLEAVLTGNFTGNWQLSLLAVATYVSLLMHGDLASLGDFFSQLNSPVAGLVLADIDKIAAGHRPVTAQPANPVAGPVSKPPVAPVSVAKS